MKQFFKNKDSWLYIPIVLLVINLIYRLIDQSKLLLQFPLDYTNDMSSYLAQLHFVKVCGFHNLCPYWYNGFISFQHSPPGWYYATYPLYLLFGDVKIALYTSILISLALIFIIIYKSKFLNLSKTKKLAFFLFFTGNAIAIGNFIRLGRAHELFAWVNFFISSFILFKYKDKEIDWKFIFAGLFYATTLLTYQGIGIFASTLFLGIFLIKPAKEKIKVALSFIFGIAISSFWWLPFVIKISKESAIPLLRQNYWLLVFHPKDIYTNIAATAISLAVLVSFYFYWKSNNKSRKEILFFLPIIIFDVLFLFRLTPFIPVLKDIFPDPYLIFFIFFAIFFSLKTDFSKLKPNLEKMFMFLVIFITIASISINIVHTPKFKEYNQEYKDAASLIPEIQGRFIILGDFTKTIYPKAFYSFAATKNIPSVEGWYPQVASPDYLEKLKKTNNDFTAKDCDSLKTDLEELNVQTIISNKDDCKIVESCNYSFVKTQGIFCVYRT